MIYDLLIVNNLDGVLLNEVDEVQVVMNYISCGVCVWVCVVDYVGYYLCCYFEGLGVEVGCDVVIMGYDGMVLLFNFLMLILICVLF